MKHGDKEGLFGKQMTIQGTLRSSKEHSQNDCFILH